MRESDFATYHFFRVLYILSVRFVQSVNRDSASFRIIIVILTVQPVADVIICPVQSIADVIIGISIVEQCFVICWGRGPGMIVSPLVHHIQTMEKGESGSNT